jgi:hypothetical protein
VPKSNVFIALELPFSIRPDWSKIQSAKEFTRLDMPGREMPFAKKHYACHQGKFSASMHVFGGALTFLM